MDEFDERNAIIDDYLAGDEIDPSDYTAYQIEELRGVLGYDDEDAPHSAELDLDSDDEDDYDDDDEGLGIDPLYDEFHDYDEE